MQAFSEQQFKQRVNKALEHVKTILDNTRRPEYPSEVHHNYEDKYELSEFLATSTIAALNNILDYLGFSSTSISDVSGKNRSVTLRLKAEEGCKFVKKETKEVESDTKHVTKAGILGKFESYSVTKVTEYFWQYSVNWEVLVFLGVDSDKGIVLQSHKRTIELITQTESTPKPVTVIRPPIDVNITWLINHLDNNRTPVFSINRSNNLCRTPRRNPEVQEFLTFLQVFHSWSNQVHSYFYNNVFVVQKNYGLNLSSITDTGVFVPVLPLFDSSSASSSKIPPLFINSFISEQARSLEEKKRDLTKVFGGNTDLIQVPEVMLLVTLLHSKHICEAYSEGVDYIENLLYKQLFSALGKHVTPTDFANYMTFHNRKIFREEYRPQPFSHAIRRPGHYPEGVLSIEDKLAGEANSNPISTVVSHRVANRPMYFALNAATKVPFYGDRYLHGYVSNQFAGSNPTNLSLHARARQFSSFILIAGRIVSADLFDPKHAIVVQNNDHIKIPLILETIPTAKEFKDAISSLSPEQQRFCKAFRSMQLESTLFGVLVIQIKPQLEKLLKLPDDSLTKEIQLSQDLLNMFIKYQIPSDLVSYDGPEELTKESKVARVKEYVGRMNEMVAGAQKEELALAQQQQQMRLATNDYSRGAMDSASDSDGDMCYDEECDDDDGGDGGWGEEKEGGAICISSPVSAMSIVKQAPTSTITSTSTSTSTSKLTVTNQNQNQQQNKNQNQEQQKDLEVPQEQVVDNVVVDYTKIPAEMDKRFEKFDDSNALRPTIIKISETWEKDFQKSLLSAPEKATIYAEEQQKEKDKAFDLLDALTKSGALSVDNASLHVIIASTHCFDKNIVDTIIQQNVNPVEKFENSTLIVASTIHRTSPAQLIAPEHLDRIQSVSTSQLLLEN